ncbi:MAG TPA: PEP-CTERM sorting domain-containing protein [Roseiarcus sp.]|jgi:hypothetical protein
MVRLQTATLIAAGLFFAGAAQAENLLPPAGPLALNLAGQPLPTSYTEYSASFTASSSSSIVTFVFRHDPGWFAFDDASVIASGGSTNLLSDGGFEGGIGSWSYFAQSGVSHTGFVGDVGTVVGGIPWSAPVHSGAHDWLDGSTEGYDGLSQTIATVAGQAYEITFWLDQRLTQPVTASIFKELSDNGDSGVRGNGIDALVYAGDALPSTTEPLTPSVPEPSVWVLMTVGFGFLGLRVRATRRGRSAVSA